MSSVNILRDNARMYRLLTIINTRAPFMRTNAASTKTAERGPLEKVPYSATDVMNVYSGSQYIELSRKIGPTQISE